MTELVNMKMSPKEIKEYEMPLAGQGNAPVYPYGLSIDLDDDQLQKLGIADLPEVGEEVMITAKALVTRTSATQRQDETDRNVCLQITDMAVGEQPEKPQPESKLYGGNGG